MLATNSVLYEGKLAYTPQSLADAQMRGDLIIWRNGQNRFPLPPTISIGQPMMIKNEVSPTACLPKQIQLTCSFRPPFEGVIEWARFHAQLKTGTHKTPIIITDLWPRQMTGLLSTSPPIQQLRELLLSSAIYLEPANLTALFVDSRICMWQHQLPQSTIKQEQANQLIHFLMPLVDANGRSALLLFLEVLQEQFAEQDGRYHQIQHLQQQFTNTKQSHPTNKIVDIVASGLQEEIATWTLSPCTLKGIEGSWQFGIFTNPLPNETEVCVTLFIEARVVTKGTFLWANTEQISHQLQISIS